MKTYFTGNENKARLKFAWFIALTIQFAPFTSFVCFKLLSC